MEVKSFWGARSYGQTHLVLENLDGFIVNFFVWFLSLDDGLHVSYLLMHNKVPHALITSQMFLIWCWWGICTLLSWVLFFRSLSDYSKVSSQTFISRSNQEGCASKFLWLLARSSFSWEFGHRASVFPWLSATLSLLPERPLDHGPVLHQSVKATGIREGQDRSHGPL